MDTFFARPEIRTLLQAFGITSEGEERIRDFFNSPVMAPVLHITGVDRETLRDAFTMKRTLTHLRADYGPFFAYDLRVEHESGALEQGKECMLLLGSITVPHIIAFAFPSGLSLALEEDSYQGKISIGLLPSDELSVQSVYRWVKRYFARVNVIHAYHPLGQVTSNWQFVREQRASRIARVTEAMHAFERQYSQEIAGVDIEQDERIGAEEGEQAVARLRRSFAFAMGGDAVPDSTE